MAQAIKDATMAYFILENTTTNNYEGIVYYLKKLVASENILTISTVSQSDIGELEQSNYNLADFIVCVKANMTTTY